MDAVTIRMKFTTRTIPQSLSRFRNKKSVRSRNYVEPGKGACGSDSVPGPGFVDQPTRAGGKVE